MTRYLSGIAILVLIFSGCSGEDAPPGEEIDLGPDPQACAGYETRGPYAAGVTTLSLDGAPVEVWYPAEASSVAGLTRDSYDIREWLPAGERDKIPAAESPKLEMNAYRDVVGAPGRFPVVLFSHGMGGYRNQSSFLMTHLASWGFVVAAPEHPERGLSILVETGAPTGDNAPEAMRGALALLEQEHVRTGSVLEGRVDASRVAVTGHSAGGGAVLEVANDPNVAAWVTFASGGFGTGGGPAIPSFMMAGAIDGIASVDQIASAYDRQSPDKRFLAIDRMGHLGFSDICAIGADRGGVLEIAVDYGIDVPQLLLVLGKDGCAETDLPPEQGWELVNHFTTAQLAYALRGGDHGLDDTAAECFSDRVTEYRHD